MVTTGLKPFNFKEWLWSAKVLTTLVWIFFPVGYIILIESTILAYEVGLDIVPPRLLGPILVTEFEDAKGITYSLYMPPIPLFAVLLLFAAFPAVYPTEKFFAKRGYANVIIEYQYIKKILYIYLATLISFTILFYYLSGLVGKSETGGVNTSHPLYLPALLMYFTLFTVPTVPICILLKLLLEHARKRFRFYYAKTCFEIISKTQSETDKAEYLSLGLNWYNKFVKRVTKSGIDIEIIYSKIVSHSELGNNILLDTIKESFQNGDELKPMRHTLALLSSWKEGATLVKESLRTKIKESSDLLIPIVTVIITIITTFFLKAPAS